ncbi:hypothetical protein [Natronorubrum sulfidifaciens]|uniref:hypothetical protein n=1 Tax=Natronorubrum sulfidifaciens TaxID=388259 RepID=UPI001267082A|nr:hypothetical protein [Natronorubrum sulfidifaciens]
MSNDPNNTTADTESESMRPTRRTVIRGVGVAGLLTMGVGSASAQQNPTKQARTQQAQTQAAKKTPKGIENAKTKVPSFVKDKLDIKFPGSGGGGGDNGDGISG